MYAQPRRRQMMGKGHAAYVSVRRDRTDPFFPAIMLIRAQRFLHPAAAEKAPGIYPRIRPRIRPHIYLRIYPRIRPGVYPGDGSRRFLFAAYRLIKTGGTIPLPSVGGRAYTTAGAGGAERKQEDQRNYAEINFIPQRRQRPQSSDHRFIPILHEKHRPLIHFIPLIRLIQLI